MTNGASALRDTDWSTHCCKLGWDVEGCYPPGVDGTHVNWVSHCKDLNVLATGDDYGLVNIFRYPVPENTHKSHSYRGHSEHVTRVEFAQGGDYLLSVGGMDQTVIQWKKKV